MNEDFKALCERSEKKIAEWMYNDLAKKYYFEIDIHCDGDYAFRHSCENGHFEIAKSLYSLRGVNIPCFGDYAFRAGCETAILKLQSGCIVMGVLIFILITIMNSDSVVIMVTNMFLSGYTVLFLQHLNVINILLNGYIQSVKRISLNGSMIFKFKF